MGLIGDGKRDLAKAIEQEVACITHELAAVVRRLHEAHDEAQGLNGLAGKFKAAALALEAEADKLADARDEALKKLGEAPKPEITERVNPKLVEQVKAAGGKEAIIA